MRWIVPLIILLALDHTTWAQGTIHFHNRGLTDPETGAIYHAGMYGNTIGASAQLYLVTEAGASTTYTPLAGIQTFRPAPNNAYFTAGQIVSIPGVAPGVTGTRVVVRAWQGSSYDSAVE